MKNTSSMGIKIVAFVVVLLGALMAMVTATTAHPLGNFTVNHFSRLEIGADRLRVHYVVDLAEISTFQELQTADSNGDGQTSPAELNAYLERVAPDLGRGIDARVAGTQVALNLVEKNIMTQTGAGGLQTLRIECDYEGEIPEGDTGAARRVLFDDRNHPDRLGWREIVVIPGTGVNVYDSTAFGNSLTDELRKYPEDMLAAPLTERTAELSFSVGPVPAGAVALRTRNGQPVVQTRDRLAELISIPKLTPWMVLLGLLIAAGLGALHALSPGHGKTVVGAYLVGSRGTARHAVFLGLTVTITHTLGVFALGLVTLFASRYVLPERLFPILSLISGAIVVVIGATLFVRRVRAALGLAPIGHHDHGHEHVGGDHIHGHDHGDGWHSHDGGAAHSHLPPGADGERVTWRSLLGLGISGGLLPCPSALVVLLSAIALHRVGYGMVLVLAFSLGLATTLTVIGLMFVYAGRLLKERAKSVTAGRLATVLPALSALVITALGAAICYEAVVSSGIRFASLFAGGPAGVGTVSTASVLALGLVFGLKHAMEADHLAAVSTIVSERKSLLSSTLVGGLWGVGHTISLLIAGVVVIVLHVQIGERLAMALEFCVALMLVTLGVNAINKLRRGGRLHFHTHQHGGREHVHPHLHAGEGGQNNPPPTRVGARPLIVGMIHGLAGSAALMLLVLSTIPSPLVGMVYIVVFGVGSIGGMMLMSGLVGLPLKLTATKFVRANLAVRGLAAVFSLGFGLFMVYQIGFVDGLFR